MKSSLTTRFQVQNSKDIMSPPVTNLIRQHFDTRGIPQEVPHQLGTIFVCHLTFDFYVFELPLFANAQNWLLFALLFKERSHRSFMFKNISEAYFGEKSNILISCLNKMVDRKYEWLLSEISSRAIDPLGPPCIFIDPLECFTLQQRSIQHRHK